jgi:threonine aldolase
MDRRTFLAVGPAGGGAIGAGLLSCRASGRASADELVSASLERGPVKLTYDGLDLSPAEYAELVAALVAHGEGIEPDDYSRGGAIERLEQAFAKALGKQRAIFMPTGTLANHVAMRELAGLRKRVIVPAESHIYNDSGDCAQTLSGLNLIPLGPGRATFSADEVEAMLDRTASGRVATEIGAIVIESPVRRRKGEMFALDEMKLISKLAREREIGLHLDGARLFIASAYTGIAPHEYSALFDTVYVSLYKSFNAPSGAVLAGPAGIIDGLYHARRMFGAGLPKAWPFAAVAHAYLDGYVERLRRAIETSEALIDELGRTPHFRFERIEHGTNVFHMDLAQGDPEQFRARLHDRGVIVRAAKPETRRFDLRVNDTLGRITKDRLVAAFTEAAAA